MKKFLCVLLSLLFTVPFLCSCTVKVYEDEMFSLDTIITFKLSCDKIENAVEYVNECKAEIKRLEKLLSATDTESDIYKINHSNGEKVKVSQETASLIKTAVDLSKETNGAFDITVYEAVKLWGFDTKEYRVPHTDEIEATVKKTGYKNIEITDDNMVSLKSDISIDLGGIAKGYIANKIYDILATQTKDINSAIVNFGGMVFTVYGNAQRKDAKWVIGVEHPDAGSDYFATLTLDSGDVTTSGSYQRYFEQDGKTYHHIIDPTTGMPAQSDMSSVTIVNDCNEKTDAMSTAFFVMGIDKTIEFIKEHNFFEENEYAQPVPYSLVILSADKKRVYVTKDLIDNGFELQQEYKNQITVEVIEI